MAAQTAAMYVNTASADVVPAFDVIETNGAGAVLSQIHHNGQKKGGYGFRNPLISLASPWGFEPQLPP